VKFFGHRAKNVGFKPLNRLRINGKRLQIVTCKLFVNSRVQFGIRAKYAVIAAADGICRAAGKKRIKPHYMPPL
jgi:hypothetical protein